mmetsp:Transcript_39626/g.64243  ORF Transcript_39626/g.64243 Transcript_39626/m.64243 type:complete len:90 (-) Transcript_39626:256-525(-)
MHDRLAFMYKYSIEQLTEPKVYEVVRSQNTTRKLKLRRHCLFIVYFSRSSTLQDTLKLHVFLKKGLCFDLKHHRTNGVAFEHSTLNNSY